MSGTGDTVSDRTYFASEVTVSSTIAPSIGVIHDKHFVVSGASAAPNTVYYSGTLDPDDFTSTGSGTIQLEDQVVGLKSFRNDLYIFCVNSIFKLSNIRAMKATQIPSINPLQPPFKSDKAFKIYCPKSSVPMKAPIITINNAKTTV